MSNFEFDIAGAGLFLAPCRMDVVASVVTQGHEIRQLLQRVGRSPLLFITTRSTRGVHRYLIPRSFFPAALLDFVPYLR
jgi:hypothetical protein